MLRRPKKVVHADMDVVDNALERGVKWLGSKQNDNGSIGLKRWEIWDTVNAVLAMISAGAHSKSIENAINFILDGLGRDAVTVRCSFQDINGKGGR